MSVGIWYHSANRITHTFYGQRSFKNVFPVVSLGIGDCALPTFSHCSPCNYFIEFDPTLRLGRLWARSCSCVT